MQKYWCVLLAGGCDSPSIRYGDVPIDQGKFFRFERRVAHVQMPGKHDPEEVIVVRLEKLAPAEYATRAAGRYILNLKRANGLRLRKIVGKYFCPDSSARFI